MALVVSLGAEMAHTHLITSTEPIQRSFMILTYVVLKILHRVNECVLPQFWSSFMGFQMSFTKRRFTVQTRLHRIFALPHTHITAHHLLSIITALLKVIHKLSECCVDSELRSFFESLLAHRTVIILSAVPAFLEAIPAEVVSTWS